MLTAYWQRGTAQRNDAPFGTTTSPLSDPESRVVNHLSVAGSRAIVEYFGSLLNAAPGSFCAPTAGPSSRTRSS